MKKIANIAGIARIAQIETQLQNQIFTRGPRGKEDLDWFSILAFPAILAMLAISRDFSSC